MAFRVDASPQSRVRKSLLTFRARFSSIPPRKRARGVWGRGENSPRKPARLEQGASPAQNFAAAPALCWREGAFTHGSALRSKALSHRRGCERGSRLGSARGADSGPEALEGNTEVHQTKGDWITSTCPTRKGGVYT